MGEIARQGLFAKHCLTAREMLEVEQLAALCNACEDLHLRLDSTMLDLPTLPTDDLFLFYQHNALLGSLLLDRYHSAMKEVTGMVHPDFRRQGIFRALLVAASQECRHRGIKRLLFPCEASALSGQAFLLSLSARREFAEHRMVLGRFEARVQDAHLRVRPARFDDLADLALILAADFAGNQQAARQHLLRVFERPNQRFAMAIYEHESGGSEPVGMLRVEESPTELGVYGFFVRPQFRGRGHGRQLLEETIVDIRAHSGHKSIMLEVDTQNLPAFNLYCSLGFEVERTYEYYSLALGS
jgi:ribosomal protein S18 acetylase RimI-like enzyme